MIIDPRHAPVYSSTLKSIFLFRSVSSVGNGIGNVVGVAQVVSNIFGKGKDVGKWVINGLTPG